MEFYSTMRIITAQSRIELIDFLKEDSREQYFTLTIGPSDKYLKFSFRIHFEKWHFVALNGTKEVCYSKLLWDITRGRTSKNVL